MQTLNYDLIILGGGPAGLSAGIYAARGNIKTAILDITSFGGQPTNYQIIENYPGYPSIYGYELSEKFEEHADKFNIDKYPSQEIISINLAKTPKEIVTNELNFNAKSIIIATGASPLHLNIPGEESFIGKGVSYCAICDGAFYKDKVVTVVGGGNSAVEEALYLTKFASRVYLIHRRDTLKADKILTSKILNNDKVEVIWNSCVTKIIGDSHVNKILYKDVRTNTSCELRTDGIFPYIGISPNTKDINGQLAQDKKGFIITDVTMMTSIDGVYAIGDVRNTPLRQVITAVSDGAIAAVAATKYIENLEQTIITRQI